LTGQFFFHHLLDNPGCKAEDEAVRIQNGGAPHGSCLVGGLDLPSVARLGASSTPNSPAFRDKIRGWETLATFAAFTFYPGGRVLPLLGIAVDPTNQFHLEPFFSIDWFLSDAVAINLAQRYFVPPRGYSTPIFETWGLAGLNSGRSETSLRLTYQF